MFDTTKEDLKDLLPQAHKGRLQLPDFQRDYVWGDEDVRSLISSAPARSPALPGTYLNSWSGSGTQGHDPEHSTRPSFQQERLRSLRFRVSAAYKGIHALLMRHGCRDFKTNRPADIMTFFNDRIDIHHIFPQAWCKKMGIEPAVFNSIVNKTPLSRASNISIGGDAPSLYLRRIEQQEHVSSTVLDEILRSHLIEPKYLRCDDFKSFFAARLQALSGLVADAMDKPVIIETRRR